MDQEKLDQEKLDDLFNAIADHATRSLNGDKDNAAMVKSATDFLKATGYNFDANRNKKTVELGNTLSVIQSPDDAPPFSEEDEIEFEKGAG